METSNHFDSCEAPICQENIDKEAIWYPGEMVCTKKPLSFFQKRQININNLLNIGKYNRDPETPLNFSKLAK